MNRYLIGFVIFSWFITHSNHARAQENCDAVLAGLITYDTTFEDSYFQSRYINWLKSNQLRTLESTRTASAKTGVTLPIEGIPVTFDGTFQKNDTQSESWSNAFATYLESDIEMKKTFFRSLKTANVDIANIWLKCVAMTTEKGTFCSATPQNANGDIELLISYRNSGSDADLSAITIPSSDITIAPSGALVLAQTLPTVIEIGRGSDRRILYKRKSHEGGRIDVNLVGKLRDFSCNRGNGARFLPVVVEAPLPPSPNCRQRDGKGLCVRCEAEVGVAGGGDSTDWAFASCQNMPKGDEVSLRWDGGDGVPGRVLGDDSGRGDCEIHYSMRINDTVVPNKTPNNFKSCHTTGPLTLPLFVPVKDATVLGGIKINFCSGGAHCHIQGRLSIYTKAGIPRDKKP